MTGAEAKCFECGTPVSYETGFAMTGGLGDGSQDRLWCPEHNPDKGRGYTLSDLQKWREDNQAARARYQMSQLERIGADVYFHVAGPTFPPEDEP